MPFCFVNSPRLFIFLQKIKRGDKNAFSSFSVSRKVRARPNHISPIILLWELLVVLSPIECKGLMVEMGIWSNWSPSYIYPVAKKQTHAKQSEVLIAHNLLNAVPDQCFSDTCS